MIKIMIVDDIPVYREYLRNFIDWEDYGFEVCCEAKDGQEALELYEIYQPDIVLADIIMPYLNGLELSEAILKENPQASIILITGNSEFEYARKAVKLGVCDYIVKPFEKEELIIALLKLQDNINRVLESRTQTDEFKSERREQLLRQCIYARKIGDNPQLEQVFEYPYFIVVTILAELYENKVAPEEIMKWKQILSSILKSMIQIDGNLEVFHDFEDNIVTVLNFKDKAAMEQYQGFEFKDIINLAKEHIGFAISVGISDYCYTPLGLRDAYYQTIYALSSNYTNHQAKVYEYRNLSLNQTNEFYSWNLIDEINKYLEVLDYDKIEKLILQELNRIREYENLEFASMIYMSLLSVLFSYFVKLGRNIDDIFGRGFHPNTILSNEASYLAKRSFVCECYQKAISYQLEHQDTKAHQIAKQAKYFIEQHFSDPELQVADISKELLVNQTYLRKMFKDEYQMTISDYITKYRMEKAKEMIKKENSKLSYISYEVGYNDTSYFSKCFKKHFGYLPSDIINKQ